MGFWSRQIQPQIQKAYHVDDFMYGFLILSSFRELTFLRVFPLLECLDITDDGAKNCISPERGAVPLSSPDTGLFFCCFWSVSHQCEFDYIDLV